MTSFTLIRVALAPTRARLPPTAAERQVVAAVTAIRKIAHAPIARVSAGSSGPASCSVTNRDTSCVSIDRRLSTEEVAPYQLKRSFW